jgi:hypothetical protein
MTAYEYSLVCNCMNRISFEPRWMGETVEVCISCGLEWTITNEAGIDKCVATALIEKDKHGDAYEHREIYPKKHK